MSNGRRKYPDVKVILSLGGDYDFWFDVNGSIQLACKVLHKLFSNTTECDPDLLKLWTAVLLKTVYGPDTFSSRFADHLMISCDACEVGLVLKGKESSRLRRFFWSLSLSGVLGGLELMMIVSKSYSEQGLAHGC